MLSPESWLYVRNIRATLTRFRFAADVALAVRETVTPVTAPIRRTLVEPKACLDTASSATRAARGARWRGDRTRGTDPTHSTCSGAGRVPWGTLGRPHLDRAAGRVLNNISSLAFGGPDLRTAYLGCLLGDAIASFEAPVAGHPPFHWTV